MKQAAPRSAGFLRIAHRGASRRAPENTLAAFDLAIRQGVDAIELDVRLTADDVPVVLHDDTLDRTTDGTGPVASCPLASVRRLDAGSWFAPRFRGERVPTLAEALDCADSRCGLNVELKADRGRGRSSRDRRREDQAGAVRLARAVGRELRRSRFSGLLVLSSFSIPSLFAARAVLPRAHLGLLVKHSLRGVRTAHHALQLHALHPHLRLATRRRLTAAHRLGLVVLVWPVNDPRAIERLAALGADGVMTDDPLLFRRFRPSLVGAVS